jgi:P pilus assembly chaperone PapD
MEVKLDNWVHGKLNLTKTKMSKVNPEKEILKWIQKQGKLQIENNEEFYITLEYSGGKYIYRFGDTVTQKDTEVKEMKDPEVLIYFQSHVVSKAKSKDKLLLKSTEQVWNYLENNSYI